MGCLWVDGWPKLLPYNHEKPQVGVSFDPQGWRAGQYHERYCLDWSHDSQAPGGSDPVLCWGWPWELLPVGR